jgi:hypothetical protein
MGVEAWLRRVRARPDNNDDLCFLNDGATYGNVTTKACGQELTGMGVARRCWARPPPKEAAKRLRRRMLDNPEEVTQRLARGTRAHARVAYDDRTHNRDRSTMQRLPAHAHASLDCAPHLCMHTRGPLSDLHHPALGTAPWHPPLPWEEAALAAILRTYQARGPTHMRNMCSTRRPNTHAQHVAAARALGDI